MPDRRKSTTRMEAFLLVLLGASSSLSLDAETIKPTRKKSIRNW